MWSNTATLVVFEHKTHEVWAAPVKTPCWNYVICKFSGHGAFGEVFLARAVGIKDGEEATTVMVKALQTRDEHQQLEFRREIDMLTKLNHANIVKLLGLCREVEPQLMITEYLDWVSWDEGVSKNQIYELNTLLSLTGLYQNI